MSRKINELIDVNDDGKNNFYVMVYQASTNTWVAKNPDDLLNAASTESVQPELPQDFTDELNNTLVPILQDDLDNQIDVDAGEF